MTTLATPSNATTDATNRITGHITVPVISVPDAGTT